MAKRGQRAFPRRVPPLEPAPHKCKMIMDL